MNFNLRSQQQELADLDVIELYDNYEKKSGIVFNNAERKMAHFVKAYNNENRTKGDYKQLNVHYLAQIVRLYSELEPLINDVALITYQQKTVGTTPFLDKKLAQIKATLRKKGVTAIPSRPDVECEIILTALENQKLEREADKSLDMRYRINVISSLIATAQNQYLCIDLIQALAAQFAVSSFSEDEEINQIELQAEYEKAYSLMLQFIADIMLFDSVDMHSMLLDDDERILDSFSDRVADTKDVAMQVIKFSTKRLGASIYTPVTSIEKASSADYFYAKQIDSILSKCQKVQADVYRFAKKQLELKGAESAQ